MLLNDKVAVIYGAGGAVGRAVARAFAREGAKLFLTGRSPAPLEAVAEDLASAGGFAEAAEVDALDERAVDAHLELVTDKAGRIDISFNAIGLPNPKVRVPLVELDVEQFSLPIATYTRSYFLTARLAARRMVANNSGVIITVTATPARTGTPFVGTARIKQSFETYAKASGMTWEQFQESLATGTHPRRLSTLAELANMAVFIASDHASGMTGTTVNLSMGSLTTRRVWRESARRRGRWSFARKEAGSVNTE